MKNYIPLKKKVATSVRSEDGFTCIKYHQTDVVQFNDQFIILNNGGWLTTTTLKRMNQASKDFYLGFHVYQKNFTWFVNYLDKTIPYLNGMVIPRLKLEVLR